MTAFRLPDTISSSEDLVSLIMEIRTYAKWFALQNNAQKTGAAANHPQPELTPTATDIIRSSAKEGKLSTVLLDDLIASLESTNRNARSFTITLAAPAPNDVRRDIIAWTRSNIAEDALINFRFNAQIVGGMIVRVGSRIYDWSFKKAILENKSKLAETLDRV